MHEFRLVDGTRIGIPDPLLDSYEEVSSDGLDHYPIVAAKLDRMHAEEPTLAVADLRGVESRTLVMVGDDEVALEHAVATYRGLPEAEPMIVPGTSHGLMVGKPALCNWVVIDFLSAEPVQTLAPIRRAGLR
jgi:pimeloyl-ACP methyl ester carboxylesterase